MKRALTFALVCSFWLASGASAQEEPATGEGAGSSFVDGLEWQVMASGCRAMADDLGSRVMIRSEHWAAMRDAGVHVAAGLPIGSMS